MNFTVEPLPIDGAALVTIKKFDDHRGHFMESFRTNVYEDLGNAFVQDNISFSKDPYTLRGLHNQCPPAAQAKLVTPIAGKIFDVIVDVRPSSPTFKQVVCATLDASAPQSILVPVGCLHGFLTLTPNTYVQYKVSAYFDAALDSGIAWDDPDLAINWPLPKGVQPVLSEKDAQLPSFQSLLDNNPFQDAS